MQAQLHNHIIQLVPSLQKEAGEIAASFKQENYGKGEIVVREGQAVSKLYFVNKGCLHLYFTDSDGSQNTIHFALENWWMTEYNAFLGNPQAAFGIGAIEDTEAMTIAKDEFDQLLIRYPLMGAYFNIIHMRAYGASLLKQKTFATVNKKDFHLYFTTHYPAFVKRVPHTILASYMGISPEELAVFNSNFPNKAGMV